MPYITDVDGWNELDLLPGDCSSLTHGTDEDKPVKPVGDLAWGLLAENDDIGGVVRKIEKIVDGAAEVCAVQVHGVVTLEYTGTNPTVGWLRLVGSATVGKVKSAAAAAGSPLQLVIAVDTTAKTVTFIMP